MWWYLETRFAYPVSSYIIHSMPLPWPSPSGGQKWKTQKARFPVADLARFFCFLFSKVLVTALVPHDAFHSALSSKTPALNLPKSLGTTENRNRTHDTNDRKDLEQVPRSVVQEEDKLHSHNRAKEECVRDRSCGERLGKVVDVGTENDPLLREG